MARNVLMKLSGNMLLSGSFKQELVITEEGVEAEVMNGLRRTKMALTYQQIAQVNLDIGLYSGATLTVINKGGADNLVVKGLSKPDGAAAKQLIEEGIRKSVAASRTGQSNFTSAADELRKLDELRRNGILTEEEFQAEKRRVLQR
jgi:hypothetical protein